MTRNSLFFLKKLFNKRVSSNHYYVQFTSRVSRAYVNTTCETMSKKKQKKKKLFDDKIKFPDSQYIIYSTYSGNLRRNLSPIFICNNKRHCINNLKPIPNIGNF